MLLFGNRCIQKWGLCVPYCFEKNNLFPYFPPLELEPQLEMAKDGVLLVAQQNAKNSRGLDIIKKELEKLPLCKYCNASE